MPALHAVSNGKDAATNQPISRLKGLISSGVLIPGAKLPPERELAPAFGVSRSSLRHAVKAMEIMGVLSQRVGDGTYLAGDADAILCEPEARLAMIAHLSDAKTLLGMVEDRAKRIDDASLAAVPSTADVRRPSRAPRA